MYKEKLLDPLDVFMTALFFISFVHPLTVLLFCLGLPFLLFRRITGCMKGLILLTARGLMNSAAAVSAGRLELLKWALLFLFSLYILLFARVKEEHRIRLRRIVGSIAAFSVSAAVFSLLISSYPVTAVFKLLAFSTVSCAVFTASAAEEKSEAWTEYFTLLFGILFLISVLLIPFDRFRTVNQDFQGIFNHVNVFGAVSALYTAAALYSPFLSRHTRLRNTLILLLAFMTFLSRSRSGMFTIMGVLGLWYLFGTRPAAHKILVCIGGAAGAVLILILLPKNTASNLSGFFDAFVYKGDTSSVWAHRLSQMHEAQIKFRSHLLTGTGFMVPYDPAVRSWRFTFSLVVEPGNLFWAVLGDTGLTGFLLFVIFLFSVGISGGRRRLYLIGAALAVNMGEMVFFSPNNYAVLIWLLLAVCAFGPPEETLKSAASSAPPLIKGK